MRHEYFAIRIRKQIERDARPSVTPTFSGGDFAPDLINKLKMHLRKIEEAQIRSVQEYKEIVKIRRATGRTNNKYMEQILKAQSK